MLDSLYFIMENTIIDNVISFIEVSSEQKALVEMFRNMVIMVMVIGYENKTNNA